MAGTFIRVQLENPSPSAGQFLNGQVVIDNAMEIKVKDVKIFLKGTGEVKVPGKEDYQARLRNSYGETYYATRTRSVTVLKKEDLISLEATLLGGAGGKSLVTLQQGTTAYPFRFGISEHLPSSYVTTFGEISYLLEVEITHASGKVDRTWSKLTVRGKLDLNLESGVAEPKRLQMVKGSKFFSCWTGQVGFVLELPRKSGFAPGEVLDFHVRITNSSGMRVYDVRAALKRVTTCSASKKTKAAVSQVICVTHRSGVVWQGDQEDWMPGDLMVPNIPPTNLGWDGKLIAVSYFLCVEMKMSGKSTLLSGRLPIKIGTIPLRSAIVGSTGVMPIPFPRTFLQSPQIFVDTAASAPYLDPPSFAEAMASSSIPEKK